MSPPQQAAGEGGDASLGSARPAVLPEVIAARGPILPPAPNVDSVAAVSPPAGDDVAAALPNDPVGSEPAGLEMEVAASPGAADGGAADSVAEAVASLVAPTADLSEPVMPMERASVVAGTSHALVSFLPFPGS